MPPPQQFGGRALDVRGTHGIQGDRRAGIAFASQRGLVEDVHFLTAGTLDLLVDAGDFGEALEVAAGLVDPLEAHDDVLSLCVVRAAQARIHAMQGEPAQQPPPLTGSNRPLVVRAGSLSRALGRPPSRAPASGSATVRPRC